MIVVDTNIIAGTYLPGHHAAAIESVVARDSHWMAPNLWRLEFRNVLSLYLRKELMTLEDAKRIARQAENRMRDRECWTAAERVLELAMRSGCSSYDCEFVSVATDLNLRLVTLDKQILKQFSSLAVSPEQFIAE